MKKAATGTAMPIQERMGIRNNLLQKYNKTLKSPNIFGKKLLSYLYFLYFCIQITDFKYNKHEENIISFIRRNAFLLLFF